MLNLIQITLYRFDMTTSIINTIIIIMAAGFTASSLLLIYILENRKKPNLIKA